MTLISKWYEKKNLMEKLAKELEQLEQNESLKEEIQFKDDLLALLEKYGRSFEDAFSVLATEAPSLTKTTGKPKGKRSSSGQPRPLQVYTNPHTKEVVETRGANHKTLKEWRKKYGADKVAEWRQQ